MGLGIAFRQISASICLRGLCWVGHEADHRAGRSAVFLARERYAGPDLEYFFAPEHYAEGEHYAAAAQVRSVALEPGRSWAACFGLHHN